MASLRREFRVGASAHEVWDAFRDLFVVHTRLAQGFVVECCERLQHHSASFQVYDTAHGGCTIVWTADLLLHAAAPGVAAMMDEGVAAMTETLESHSAAA